LEIGPTGIADSSIGFSDFARGFGAGLARRDTCEHEGASSAVMDAKAGQWSGACAAGKPLGDPPSRTLKSVVIASDQF
jgi:hypothetical protein